MKIISKYLTTPLGVFAGILVLVLSLITVVDITSRMLGVGSVPGSLEVSEMLLVVCVFSAFGAAQRTRTHVATSVLTERVSPKVRRIMHIVAAIAVLVMLVALVVSASQEAVKSIISGEFRFGLVQVPLWPAKLAVAVGMFVFLVEFVRSYIFTKNLAFADDVQMQELVVESTESGEDA